MIGPRTITAIKVICTVLFWACVTLIVAAWIGLWALLLAIGRAM